MGSEVLGRGAELAELHTFTASLVNGPTALLVLGEAGIGKTTVWQEGVRLAGERGHRVLTSRSVEAEVKLAYATLGDLLGPVLDDLLAKLPIPQRRALEVALLLADPEETPPDRRAVGLAVLSGLRATAAERPVVLALDDLQWCDPATIRVLSFAIRRLGDDPVGVLGTLRGEPYAQDPLGLTDALPPGGLSRLVLPPLSLNSLARMHRARSSADLPRPLLLRLEEASGGNPFLFLELARAVSAPGVEVEPGKPLPVPQDVRALLGARLRGLAGECREPLLYAALMVRPTLLAVGLVSDGPRRAERGLLLARDAGVVEIDDDAVRFSHPLLASAVYAQASGEERRRAHRRIAAATIDPEERARHLALASSGPNERVAAHLEESSLFARRRGAPDAAAELAELAARLTPAEDRAGRERRRLDWAWYLYDAGDVRGARAVAQQLASSAAKPNRASAMSLWIASLGNDVRSIAQLGEKLVSEAGNDTFLLALGNMAMSRVAYRAGTMGEAADHAARGVDLARRCGDEVLLATALADWGLIEYARGRNGLKMLREASGLEDKLAGGRSPATVRQHLGVQLLWAGDLDGARSALRSCLDRARQEGSETNREAPLRWLAEVEVRAGHFDLALTLADEALEICLEHGLVEALAPPTCARARARASLGDAEGARRDAQDALKRSVSYDCRLDEITSRSVLAFLDLSMGDASAAVRELRRAAELVTSMGIEEPGVFPFVSDLAEALIALRELEEAEELARLLEESGRVRDRPLASATGGRCLGLVAAARGSMTEALAHVDRAVAEHERVEQPLEFARTLLVRGEILRRAKRRREAREILRTSVELFEDIGAPLWAGKARAAMARIGGRAQSPVALTPAEAQIAALVAEGRTNAEVAGDLFISIKTVEANLSRIYRKLGIRTRREIAGALGERVRSAQT